MPTAVPETSLAHIQDNQLPAGTFTTLCHTWTVGPLSIQACVDTTAKSVTGSVSLLGVVLDHFSLDENEIQTTIGGSIDGFKAEATISATFATRTWSIDAILCAPIVGCQQYKTSHTW